MTPPSILSATKALQSHRVLLAVLVLPMLLGSMTVWSLADRAERTDQVRAVVVNDDKPVIKKGQPPVAAGRILAAGLTSPTESQDAPLAWELTDAQDAVQGLEDGEYHAVLTIPRDFSTTVSRSLTGKDPQRAAIELTTDDATSPLAAQIAEQVSRVAADRLGEGVTRTYLNTLYASTGKLATKLGEAADGAEQIADGTDRLGDGTEQFSGGLGRLAGGAQRLSGGAERLGDGASRLAGGTDRLASGADRLAGGLGTLERRTDPLPRQTDRLADGAAEIAKGVDAYSKLLEGWAQACSDPLIAARAPRLCVFTNRAVGVNGTKAQEFRQGAHQLAGGARQLADAMPALTQAIDKTASGAGRLADGAQKLTTGTKRLAGGAQQLAGGADRLADGALRAADGAEQLSSGTERLEGGTQRLASGLEKGADAIPAYDAEERRNLAGVIAAPVAAKSGDLGETPNGETQLAPATIAFVLYLGAFVTYLVRPALPARLLGRPRSASRIASSGLLPGVVIGVVQAVLLYVAMLVLGADLGSPVATLLLMLIAATSFSAINQALVALLGRRRGWLTSIAFAGLQAVSMGGVIPLDTAPWPLRALNAVMPMTSLADGLAATVLGGPGGFVVPVLLLLAWGGLAFFATTRAARRRQMTDLDELRQVEETRERQLVG